MKTSIEVLSSYIRISIALNGRVSRSETSQSYAETDLPGTPVVEVAIIGMKLRPAGKPLAIDPVVEFLPPAP